MLESILIAVCILILGDFIIAILLLPFALCAMFIDWVRGEVRSEPTPRSTEYTVVTRILYVLGAVILCFVVYLQTVG